MPETRKTSARGEERDFASDVRAEPTKAEGPEEGSSALSKPATSSQQIKVQEQVTELQQAKMPEQTNMSEQANMPEPAKTPRQGMLGSIRDLMSSDEEILDSDDLAMTGKTKGIWAWRIIVILLVIAAILSYFFVPAVNEGFNDVLMMFATGDFDVAREFIAEYGVYAAAISFLLMVLQSIAAPLPAFIITIANANLFGWWQGAILSWVSSMVGAALCFLIARILGREVVEKLTAKIGFRGLDVFFARYGNLSILICRLLPFISFDFVSYAAGLTSMRFLPFIVFTGLGQLPATIIYSYVGGMLTGGAQMLVTALFILFAIGALIVLIRALIKQRDSRVKASDVKGDASNEQ